MLVSSHLINEMALTAERLVVIGRGTLIAETSVDDFVARHQSEAVRIVTPTPQRFVAALSRAGARPAVEDDGAIVASGLSSADIGELAADQALTVHELTPLRASLEDVFMELTEHVGRVPLPHQRPGRRRRAGRPAERTVMTTIPVTAPRRVTGGATSGPWRAGLPQTMRAEWTKLVSLRSTRWTLLVTAVGTFLVTLLATRSALHHSGPVVPGVRPDQPVPGRARHRVARPRRARRPGHQRRVRHGHDPLLPGRHAPPRRAADGQGPGGRAGHAGHRRGAQLRVVLRGPGRALGRGADGHPRPARRAAGGRPVRRLPLALRPARPRARHHHPAHGRRHRGLHRRAPCWRRSCSTLSAASPVSPPR